MNIKRYTLPVLVAAGLHGALFLSSSGSSSGIAYAKPVKKITTQHTPMDIVEPPPEDNVDKPEERDVSAAPRGGDPLPSLPETPVKPSEEVFTQPVDLRPPVKIDDTGVRTIGRPGVPDGIGIGDGNWRGTKIFGLGDLDRAPNARVQRAPDYPPALRQQGIGGTVVVEFSVDREGRVTSANAVRYSHREFVEPALRAVREWRFEPGVKDGAAVPFRMMIPIEFGVDH